MFCEKTLGVTCATWTALSHSVHWPLFISLTQQHRRFASAMSHH